MRKLITSVPFCQTCFMTYWSDPDELVLPQRNAPVNHADLNVHRISVHTTGHTSLPLNGDVVHGIWATLAHPGVKTPLSLGTESTRRH